MSSKHYVCGRRNAVVPVHLNMAQYMFESLKKYRNEIALVNMSTKEQLTYNEFLQLTVNFSTALRKIGVQKGDVVALGSEKRNEFLPIMFAVILSGATFTPVNVQSGKAILIHKMNTSRPKFFIVTKEFWKVNSDTLLPLDFIKTYIAMDDDLANCVSMKDYVSETCIDDFAPTEVLGQVDTALLLYSSGTTGMPKAVALTHLKCIFTCTSSDFNLPGDNDFKNVYVFGEWYHNYDIFSSFKFLSEGKTLVYVPEFSIEGLYQNIDNYKIEVAMLVPSIIVMLLKADFDNYKMDTLKIIYSRSSPLHGDTIKSIKERIPNLRHVIQGYGLTELGEPASELYADKGFKCGSVGKIAPGFIIKVVDTNTEEALGPNQHGEIRIKSPSTQTDVYLNVDRSIYMDNEGFFKTGDIGYYDEEEYLFIVARITDIICCYGYKIAPLQLETILLSHPDVKDSGAVGVPDPDYVELPAAFVEKKPGSKVTEQELVDYVAEQVPPYMCLTGGVRFIEKIPRNYRGKILRKELKALL